MFICIYSREKDTHTHISSPPFSVGYDARQGPSLAALLPREPNTPQLGNRP